MCIDKLYALAYRCIYVDFCNISYLFIGENTLVSFMNSFEEYLKGTLTFFRMYYMYLSTEGRNQNSKLTLKYRRIDAYLLLSIRLHCTIFY